MRKRIRDVFNQKRKPIDIEWHSNRFRFCDECHEPLEKDWSYCPHCGRAIEWPFGSDGYGPSIDWYFW